MLCGLSALARQLRNYSRLPLNKELMNILVHHAYLLFFFTLVYQLGTNLRTLSQRQVLQKGKKFLLFLYMYTIYISRKKKLEIYYMHVCPDEVEGTNVGLI